MNNLYSYDLFLFDLDGLLINTEPIYYKAFQNTWKAFSVFVPIDFSTYYSLAALGRSAFQQALISQFPQTAAFFPAFFNERDYHYKQIIKCTSPQLMEGAEDLLNRLIQKNKPFGVVTNSSSTITDYFRDKLPLLNQAHFWVTRDLYSRAKPAPDSYQYAYQHYGIGKKILGFEDSLKGLRALAKIPATLIAINSHQVLSSRSHPDLYDKRIWFYPSLTACIEQLEQKKS